MNQDLWKKWSEDQAQKYGASQWLLSKWETIEGVVWPREKIELMIADLRAKLELGPGHDLLDVGSGGGWIAQGLSPACRSGAALDFAPAMLRVAAENRFNLMLALGDARALPFAAASFDRVLVYFTLMNFPEREKIALVLRECLGILKPGGICLAGQFPLASRSAVYDREKRRYVEWCRANFQLGADLRDREPPPQVLFADDFGDWLRTELKAPVKTVQSFNHFWRKGEPENCAWRVDYVIKSPLPGL